jgi:membrane associated rhomboid family serine protease
MIGASGAIGGVMGAYSRLYLKVHILTLLVLGFYDTVIAVPAIYMLDYWFLLQFLSGLPSLGSTSSGIAFWAHVCWFLADVILSGLFTRQDLLNEHCQAQTQSRRH